MVADCHGADVLYSAQEMADLKGCSGKLDPAAVSRLDALPRPGFPFSDQEEVQKRWEEPAAQKRSGYRGERAVVLCLSKCPYMPQRLGLYLTRDTRAAKELLYKCEAGLPSWAITIPAYAWLPSPKRVRWLVATMIIVAQVVAMAAGFYDMHKNFAFIQTAFAATQKVAALVFWYILHKDPCWLAIPEVYPCC